MQDQTGKIKTDLQRRIVEVDGYRIHLTNREFDIWELLVLTKNAAVSKDLFMFHLYGTDANTPESKIIDVLICKLRSKLTSVTGGENYIETVWGRGYMLCDPATQFAKAG